MAAKETRSEMRAAIQGLKVSIEIGKQHAQHQLQLQQRDFTQQLMRIGALGDDALIIIETGNDETMDADILAAAGLELLVARRYGRALVHFLGRTSG